MIKKYPPIFSETEEKIIPIKLNIPFPPPKKKNLHLLIYFQVLVVLESLCKTLEGNVYFLLRSTITLDVLMN